MKLYTLTLMALASTGILTGCAPSKRPFLIVEVCLSKTQDLSQFTDEMRSIAHSNDLVLIDKSANTQRDLELIGNPNAKIAQGQLVNMGIERDDGTGVMIGNLGLPAGQLAVGFSEGSDPVYSHRFADSIVTRLKQHWRIEVVPSGAGAKGIKGCD